MSYCETHLETYDDGAGYCPKCDLALQEAIRSENARPYEARIAALESALAEEKKAHEGLRDAMAAAEALREDAEDERDAEEVAHGITKARLHNAILAARAEGS